MSTRKKHAGGRPPKAAGTRARELRAQIAVDVAVLPILEAYCVRENVSKYAGATAAIRMLEGCIK